MNKETIEKINGIELKEGKFYWLVTNVFSGVYEVKYIGVINGKVSFQTGGWTISTFGGIFDSEEKAEQWDESEQAKQCRDRLTELKERARKIKENLKIGDNSK